MLQSFLLNSKNIDVIHVALSSDCTRSTFEDKMLQILQIKADSVELAEVRTTETRFFLYRLNSVSFAISQRHMSTLLMNGKKAKSGKYMCTSHLDLYTQEKMVGLIVNYTYPLST